jgi:hypothetical protein
MRACPVIYPTVVLVALLDRRMSLSQQEPFLAPDSSSFLNQYVVHLVHPYVVMQFVVFGGVYW